MEIVLKMPSVSTLNNFIRGIPTTVGFPDSIFQLLDVKSGALPANARYCVITVEEMSLNTELCYDRASDPVTGLVELPEKRLKPRNQALVFMVKGVSIKWKQTVGFFFASSAAGAADLGRCSRPQKVQPNSAGAADLGRLLKILIQKLRCIGLHPVAVVCDQATTNRSSYTRQTIF